jgi:DNA invertase Pin-like site-specific DNA recombinase
MSSVYGYLRYDVNEQNVDHQLDQLKANGAIEIFKEKPSSRQRSTTQLNRLMSVVKEGDTIVVTSLDHIAHNTKHLLEIMESLYADGVSFKVINSTIDTSSSHGDVIRMLLGEIVEFERQVVRERQFLGIAKAKKEGRYKGRKPTARAKTEEVMALNKQGLTRQKIADELGIGVASVYRILKTNTEQKKPPRKIAKKSEKTPIDKQKPIKRKPTRDDDTEQLSFF